MWLKGALGMIIFFSTENQKFAVQMWSCKFWEGMDECLESGVGTDMMETWQALCHHKNSIVGKTSQSALCFYLSLTIVFQTKHL